MNRGLLGKLEEKRPLEKKTDVERIILLKVFFKILEGCGMDSFGSRNRHMVGCCERGNEPLRSIKVRASLVRLKKCQLLVRNSASFFF